MKLQRCTSTPQKPLVWIRGAAGQGYCTRGMVEAVAVPEEAFITIRQCVFQPGPATRRLCLDLKPANFTMWSGENPAAQQFSHELRAKTNAEDGLVCSKYFPQIVLFRHEP